MGQGYGRDWVSAVPGAIVCRRNGGDHGRRGGSTRYIVVEVKDGMGAEGDGGNEGLECGSIFMWLVIVLEQNQGVFERLTAIPWPGLYSLTST